MDRLLWGGKVAFLRVRAPVGKHAEEQKEALANVSKFLHLKRKLMPDKI